MTFIDNGDGMTGDEMVKHLNSLSSTGHKTFTKITVWELKLLR